MRPEKALEVFQEYLDKHGVELASLTPEAGVPLALSFYRAERSDVLAKDADMLLFQWGTYDWGQGEFFEVDISRQLLLDDSGDDESIWQLLLTFKFLPTTDLRSLGAGQKWYKRHQDLEPFEPYFQSTPAFSAVRDRKAHDVELDFECAD